jgi:hypothetical protein
MRPALPLAIAAATFVAGCYRVTVITGAPPATTATPPAVVTLDRPWQHSFINGLVPPSELNVQQQCPNGIARVMTERSFVNEVASFVTSGIYSPMRTVVTCASSPTPR